MKALGVDFIHRVMATSAVLAGLSLLFVSVYYDWRFGLGIFIGTAWGIANLHFLTQLVGAVVEPGLLHKRKVVLLALIKFPVLYGAAYLILHFGDLSMLSFLIGFNIIFAVALLKVLGRLLNERLEQVQPPDNLNRVVR
jgi:hypothetical protein